MTSLFEATLSRVARALCATAIVGAATLSGARTAGAEPSSAAQLAELEALRAQIATMSERLQALEAQVRASSAADAVVSAGAPASQARAVTFAGDVRVRTESIDEDGLELRRRDRVRARAGVTAHVTDSVTAGARVASGGRDPRTSNATLTGENARKDVGLDLAYLQWRARGGLRTTAGKMENPLWRPQQSLFHSADVTPEGWALEYGGASGWFGGAMHFWLEERGADDDSAVSIAQFGHRLPIPGAGRLSLAVSYSDYREVEGRKPFLDGVSSYGNTTLSDGSLAHDFDVIGAAAEWDTVLLLRPLSLFVELARNVGADDRNVAAAVGGAFGDASAPGGWQFGYQYELLEKDALFAQTINGDFNNGLTDTRGHVFKATYGLARRWSVSFALMLSELNMDVRPSRGVHRAQIDLHAKY